ncbi:MAG: LytTR family DNA-binding domain-containing protein [Clostridium sp.]|nr:LytTR family DNA-binding domain-containing protein [Clostridium sp.]MCM1398271.1 LytTR family DNA-binding domain-containing protein [Clostridium sp.]MCM1459065.1 LytTR family DNA-binding domain-containing protein [Bacteroides sp.]
MLKIGICDDDREFIVQLEELLQKYIEKNRLKAEIQGFTQSRELFQFIENGEMFDILFLDIEIDAVSGIDIGRALRLEYHNDYTQIVFISLRENYALQLFDMRPLNFLVKPVEYKKIEYIMDEYSRLFNIQNNYFEYQVGKQKYRIDERSILYFQSFGKKTFMVTSTGQKEFYGKLSDAYTRLNGNIFCAVHKSYIINLRYVSEYGNDKIEMTNGDVIPVSRSMRDKLNEKIIENEWGTK